VTLTRRTFRVLGTVIGVYLIETGTVGLLILGAPAYSQQLFAGAVLILATIGARYRGREVAHCKLVDGHDTQHPLAHSALNIRFVRRRRAAAV
jgi:hypothetical protein